MDDNALTLVMETKDQFLQQERHLAQGGYKLADYNEYLGTETWEKDDRRIILKSDYEEGEEE